MHLLLKFSLPLAVCGVALFAATHDEYQLAKRVQPTPKRITCEELITAGPGDNANVILTDFVLCDFSFVHRGGDPNNWREVWIPVVPKGSEFHQRLTEARNADGTFTEGPPALPEVRVIVRSHIPRSKLDLRVLARRDGLPGMVLRASDAVGGKERKLLAEAYPGIDFSKAWVLSHEHPYPEGGISMMIVSAALVLVGMVGSGLWLHLIIRHSRSHAKPPPLPNAPAGVRR